MTNHNGFPETDDVGWRASYDASAGYRCMQLPLVTVLTDQGCTTDRTPQIYPDHIPFEIHTMILRYFADWLLYELRRPDSTIPFTARMFQWVKLRLVSKTMNRIMSQLVIEGEELEELLKRKQLEKLGYVIEAWRVTADTPPINSGASVPKLKFLCGRFWGNPMLSSDTICSIFSILRPPHLLNFAIKLESWILRNRERSEVSSDSGDGYFFFERGDWVVNCGDLQIRRVSTWRALPTRRIGVYLANEAGGMSAVHERIGHERRWFMECTNEAGRKVLSCLVNFRTTMVWDHLGRRLYNFEGRQYFIDGDSEDEAMDEE